MAVEQQLPDGSYAGVREYDDIELWRAGGKMGSPGSLDSSGNPIPAYFGGATLAFNIGGGTDSAGGLLAWQNKKGFDIIVTSHVLDVTTIATSACSASFGAAVNSTTSTSNMISAQNVHALGTFNGGALSVVVPNNGFITGSVSSGTSSGLVARAYFVYTPRPAAGGA